MALEFDPTAHERSVERQGRPTVVPALNEKGFLPQARPIKNLLLRERMVARKRREDPFAVEWRCHGVRPERVARHQCDVDTTLLDRRLHLPFIHFRYREPDPGMLCPPPGQQAAQRFTDRRHAHSKADFAHDAVAVLITGVPDRVELGQSALDVGQYRPAAAGQANPSMAALEQCKAELVLKSADATADRGGIDSESLGGTGKVSCRRRSLQIHQITDLYVEQALQVLLCASHI
jgi:hypothetical protein